MILSPCSILFQAGLTLTWLLLSFVACSPECEDLSIWNGRPQPIGIDFSTRHMLELPKEAMDLAANVLDRGAVLARPEGLKLLAGEASGTMERSDDYDFYMYNVYQRREIFEEERQIPANASKTVCRVKPESFCKIDNVIRAWLVSRTSRKKPMSKFKDVISQFQAPSFLDRLWKQISQWLGFPEAKTGVSDKDFVLPVKELLDTVKNSSEAEFNIIITSAVLSLPPWIDTHTQELFSQACMLAEIETLSDPCNRVDSVSRMAKSTIGKNTLFVLDHGQYHLDIHRLAYNEDNGLFTITDTRSLDGFGSMIMDILLMLKIINTAPSRHRSTLEGVNLRQFLRQVNRGRTIIHDMASFFPTDIPFKNRSLPLNLTCPLEVNITGEHVGLIEEEYMGKVSTAIRDALWNVPNVAKFLRVIPDETYQSLSFSSSESIFDLVNDTLQVLTAKGSARVSRAIGASTHTIDGILILDSESHDFLLQSAAERALGWDDTVMGNRTKDYREKSLLLARAAAGAAMRAKEAVHSYDGWKTIQMLKGKCQAVDVKLLNSSIGYCT